jgi:hypothetical protein
LIELTFILSRIVKAYPTLNAYFNKIATPKAKAAIKTANAECSNVGAFAFQNLLTYNYTSVGPRLLFEPPVYDVFTSLQLGKYREYTPTAPLFVLHGTEDEVRVEVVARSRQLMSRVSSSSRSFRWRLW